MRHELQLTAYNQCMKQNYYNAQAAHARCVAEPVCRDRLIDKERSDRLFTLTMVVIVATALFMVYNA